MGTVSPVSGRKAEEQELELPDKPSFAQLQNYVEEFSQLTRTTESQLRNVLAQWARLEDVTPLNPEDKVIKKGGLFCDFHAILSSARQNLESREKKVAETIVTEFPSHANSIRYRKTPESTGVSAERGVNREEIALVPEIFNASQFPNLVDGSNPENVNSLSGQSSPLSKDDVTVSGRTLPVLSIKSDDGPKTLLCTRGVRAVEPGNEFSATVTPEPKLGKEQVDCTQAVVGWNFEDSQKMFLKSYFTDDESSDSAEPGESSRNPNAKIKPEASSKDSGGTEDAEQSKKRPKAACFVSLKRIPSEIVDETRFGPIIIDDQLQDLIANPVRQKSTTESPVLDDCDELDKAIRRLQNFDGKVRPQTRSAANSGKSCSSSGTVKSLVIDEFTTREDDSSTEDEAEPARLKNNLISPVPPALILDGNSEDESTDSDYLNATVDSDDEKSAKRDVLGGCRNTKEGKVSDLELNLDGKGEEKKSGGGSYFLPSVCRIRKQSDSEASSSDESVSLLSSTQQRKKRVILSDTASDASDSAKEPGGKNSALSDIEEIPRGISNHSVCELTTDDEIDKEADVLADDSLWTQRVGSQRVKRQLVDIASSDSDTDDFREGRQSQRRTHSSQKYSMFGGASGMTTGIHRPKKAKVDEIIDLDDTDDEDDSQNSRKGRKNIRGIIEDKSALTQETQAAADEEEERQLRLARRQAEFNQAFAAPLEARIQDSKIILDLDPRTKKSLVSVDPSIVKNLKPHQAEGIRFMWNNCFESVEMYKRPGVQGGGCILAHCMGLGKTLQAIGFIHTVLTNEHLHVKRILIVCPLNTVHNWHKEISFWLKDARKKIDTYKLYDVKSMPLSGRIKHLQTWKEVGGVGIIHYDLFRNLVRPNPLRTASEQARIDECLLDPGADLVICDEGHVMKNFQSKLCIALNRVRTKRRVILTGTPLQNNLMEYHTMMHFVKPHLLGTRKEFANRFANPITNGQHRDSTSMDVRIMKRRAHVLHKVLDPSVQRKDYSILVPFLPPKFEYAIIINMTEIQVKLYNRYLELIGGGAEVMDRIKFGFFLGDFATLSKIWSHPYNLSLPKSKDRGKSGKKLKKEDTEGEQQDNDNGSENENELPTAKTVKGKTQLIAKTEFENRVGQWWLKFFPDPTHLKAMEYSTKLIILKDILTTCALIGDKVLIFSQYLYSLNLIEDLLKAMDSESKRRSRGDGDAMEIRWRKDKEYFRIDGSVKSEDRQRDCEEFNKPDSRSHVYLVSTRAGGVGINLVGANRVVIFDASFNPSNDMQAIFRVFRFGQKKPCYIYRLLAKGTMEEKVYNRQVVKLSLSGRVVDEMQIERHYTTEELVKMYQPIPEEPEARPIPSVPKDKLLADLVSSQKYQDMIHTYFEHDSLLENQLDEKLSDEERRVAWEDYENEKRGRSSASALFIGQQNFMSYDDDYMSDDSDTPLIEPGPSTGFVIDILQQNDGWFINQIRKMYPNLESVTEQLEQYYGKVADSPATLRDIKGKLQAAAEANQFPSLLQEFNWQFESLKQSLSRYLDSPPVASQFEWPGIVEDLNRQIQSLRNNLARNLSLPVASQNRLVTPVVNRHFHQNQGVASKQKHGSSYSPGGPRYPQTPRIIRPTTTGAKRQKPITGYLPRPKFNQPRPYVLPSNARVTTSYATNRPNIPATVTSSQASFQQASVNSTNPLPHPSPSYQRISNLQPRPTAQPTYVPQSSLPVRRNNGGF